MLRTKIFETYYPNAAGIADEYKGNGKEYDLYEIAQDQELIDYDDYYHSTFDSFWSDLLNRYEAYKIIKPTANWFNDTETYSFKNNFQKKLLKKYRSQQENKGSNPYWCYVKMNDSSFYKEIAGATSGLKYDCIEFLINQNKYIDASNKIQTYGNSNPNYKNVDFYMGIDEFKDLNESSTIQKFHYYEFKSNPKPMVVQHKVSSIRIDAPLGTVFYLNHVLNPVYVSKYANPWIIDTTKGVYTLDLEDYLDLRYITFPKDAIPDYYQIDPDTGEAITDSSGKVIVDQDKMKELGWTVSYQYDDDYDIIYEDN